MIFGKGMITLVALALCAVAAEAQVVRQEVIPFESAASSVADVLNGTKGQKLTLAGFLRLPKADQKQPVVILMPGAGAGIPTRGTVDEWSRVLNEAGIATFTVDSFSARGIYTLADAIKLTAITRLPDAFGARAALVKHPLIDAKRIAVMGFSHGGTPALYTNLVRFQKQYGEAAFAAHISIYAVCGVRFRDDERLAGPLMMLHGAADNWVPAAPCRDYAARLKNAGSDVRLIEYADAYHIFDAPVLAKVTQFPNVMTPAGCRLEESGGGVLLNAETKQPLAPTDSCWVKGTSAGYNEAAAKKAHEDVKAFLAEIFQLK